MNTLARELHRTGKELPVVALLRIGLAPAVCVASLALCVAAYAQPVTPQYLMLGVLVALISLRIFGELPLVPREKGLGLFFPSRGIIPEWAAVVGILLFLAFATKLTELFSRKVLITWIVITPFALHFAQVLVGRLVPRLVSVSQGYRRKIIVGVNDAGRELARAIAADPCLGLLLGFFDDRADGERTGRLRERVLGPLDKVTRYVKRYSVSEVYITLPMADNPRVVRLLDGLRDTTASVYFVPSVPAFDLIQARFDDVAGIPVIAVCETPFSGINGVLKRVTDVAVAVVALLLLWPLMLAIAIGIKLGSPGPVLFKQRRYGLNGKDIVVYKFRTMTVCEDGSRIVQAKEGDQRITPFGRVLRKTSLDELPQFINVLFGTMSVVGPRPHAIAHNEQYRALIDGYMIRHKVKPGITGWAQVNGFRGETETLEKMRQRIEYDLDYLKNWSLSLDLWIIFRTAMVVFKGQNAY